MIPDEAVKAAARTLHPSWRDHATTEQWREIMRDALEAAAPHMRSIPTELQERTMSVEELAKDIRDIPVAVIGGPPVDLTGVLAEHLHNLGYRK